MASIKKTVKVLGANVEVTKKVAKKANNPCISSHVQVIPQVIIVAK